MTHTGRAPVQRQHIGVVDAQVHTWEADNPQHPWDPAYGNAGPLALMRAQNLEYILDHDELIRAMDAAGVDAALAVTSGIYGFDNSYAFEAVARFPERLAVVGRVDPDAADLTGRLWEGQRRGLVGIRIAIATDQDAAAARDGKFERLLAAAERVGVTVCVGCPGYLEPAETVVRAHPGLQFVIDHLGLMQYPRSPDPDHFERLPLLLAMSRNSNLAVKTTGLPTLSELPFPYRDVWPVLDRLLDAFGSDRVLWGSDFTRCRSHHGYSEALDYFVEWSAALSLSERRDLIGGNLQRLFNWPSVRRP